jgi:hypothetical protein
MSPERHSLQINEGEWNEIKTLAAEAMRRVNATQEQIAMHLLFNKLIGDQLEREIAEITNATREKLAKLLPTDLAKDIAKEADGPAPQTFKLPESKIWLQHMEDLMKQEGFVIRLLKDTDNQKDEQKKQALEGMENIFYLDTLIKLFPELQKAGENRLASIAVDDERESELVVKEENEEELSIEETRELENLRKEKNNSITRNKKRAKIKKFLEELAKISLNSLLLEADPNAEEMKLNLDFIIRKDGVMNEKNRDMIEQISPDVLIHRAKKAVEFLTTFLIEAPVQFFPPDKKPLDIEEILKREYILTFREEIQQVVEADKKTKKEKKKSPKPNRIKLSKTQLGCGGALLIAVLGIIGISKIPGKPKPTANVTPSSYPVDTTPGITSQPPTPRATESTSTPEKTTEIQKMVFENVGFNEVDTQTHLSYKGTFTFELNILKSGAVQIDIHKQGGDPRNMDPLLFGWVVVHQGKILMSSATTLRGPDNPRPGEPRYIHPELKKAYGVFQQFLTTENPELPEHIRIAIFGE